MLAVIVVTEVPIAQRADQGHLGMRLMLQAAADEGEMDAAVERRPDLDKVAIDEELGRCAFRKRQQITAVGRQQRVPALQLGMPVRARRIGTSFLKCEIEV
jgi:hypothetical protein